MKKVKFLSVCMSFMILAVVLLNIVSADSVHTDEKVKTFINEQIDVGDEIYVQHDEDNNNIYDLKISETGLTTVYKVVVPEFTANKAWTTTGDYVDNWCEAAHGATAPKDYINVKEGEEYFVKTYGVGWTGKEPDNTPWPYYAPILFLDDNDEVVCDMLTNTLSASKKGVIVEVPEGATKMHITMYNNQSFTLQKVLYLSEEEFNNLPNNRSKLETKINQKYEEYVEDRTIYQNIDKGYITFVNDDTWGSIDEYSEMFIEKDIPLVLATVPELLIENASSQEETRLDVARRVEKAGGEIIAHNSGVLKQEDFEDYNKMYSFFVRTKQMFNYYGFDVNGIILAGGQGQVVGAKETEEWASSIYSYSDLYGVKYDKEVIALDSVYYHYRTGLSNYKSDYDKIIQTIDDAIENNKWIVFYFHSYNEIDKDVLAQVLDYVNSKSEEELEVVTYKEMYDKNAIKESEVLNKKTTYYVSNEGTSEKGTNPEEPMSYEVAKQKKYISGDTILFKCGETFYGTFNPNIYNLDNEVVTISSYGEGEMPVITGYKIADSSQSWELYSDDIYRIDLTDITKFSGLDTTDANSTNIGFLEDVYGQKYYEKVSSLENIENEYDFYCDGKYMYIKSENNPYNELGTLKLATKTNLFFVKSNMKVNNLRICGTGAHGIIGSEEYINNVEISNNIIEDIGGSYLSGSTRYGNGIEFYGTNVSDLLVHNNIIRNVYDVGFTIQGTKGSGKNVVVKRNVFVQNSQDSEIWESGSATGIESYEFMDNLSINSGRGWGYEARTDKYASAHILFWGYSIENTDIYFHNNTVYNPRRLYFIEQSNQTDIFFKEKDLIKSDYNNYMMAEDSLIYRHLYKVGEKDTFISEFSKDKNSMFNLIEVDENITMISANSNNINEIRKLFSLEDKEEETKENTTEESTTEESTTEESTTEESTTEESTTEESATNEGTTEESRANESATNESVIKESTREESIKEASSQDVSATKTGDKNSILIWISILAICSFTFLVIIFGTRKKED